MYIAQTKCNDEKQRWELVPKWLEELRSKADGILELFTQDEPRYPSMVIFRFGESYFTVTFHWWEIMVTAPDWETFEQMTKSIQGKLFLDIDSVIL
jgi:hypothetical protein